MSEERLLNLMEINAARQMAVDEAITLACSEKKPCLTLRFYVFNPPAITIGYGQEISKFDLTKIREKGFDLVRRITGGTAVLHKNDLVYSLVMPENILPHKVVDAYNFLSGGLVEGLKNLGLKAEKKFAEAKRREASCYLNENPYDVIVNNRKISGNAQARIKGVVLQHGTIIIEDNLSELFDCLACDNRQRNSFFKAASGKVTSVEEELGRKPSVAEVEKAMISGFGTLFSQKGIFFRESGLTDYEKKLAERLYREKYSTDKWNY